MTVQGAEPRAETQTRKLPEPGSFFVGGRWAYRPSGQRGFRPFSLSTSSISIRSRRFISP